MKSVRVILWTLVSVFITALLLAIILHAYRLRKLTETAMLETLLPTLLPNAQQQPTLLPNESDKCYNTNLNLLILEP